MPKRKKGFEDPPIYTGFTMACVHVAKGKQIKPINASVRCKEDALDKKHGYPSYCERCGWNPKCKEKRLIKMVGVTKARILIAQSEDLAIKTKKEINEGSYPYVF